jgi:hypothetical protein
MLALHAGMRDAEIRGLQWREVDLYDKTELQRAVSEQRPRGQAARADLNNGSPDPRKLSKDSLVESR